MESFPDEEMGSGEGAAQSAQLGGGPRSDPSVVLQGTSPALLQQQDGTCAPEVPARECERSTCLGVQK